MAAVQPFIAGNLVGNPELEKLKRGAYMDGVENVANYMTPTQRAAGANMSVDVASGAFWIAQTRYTYAGGNQAINAAHATLPRWDIIYFTSAGIQYTAGTASSTPAMPTHPAASVLIATVYVAAAATQIVDADIRDETVLVPGSTGGQTAGTRINPLGLFCVPVGGIIAWAKSLAGVPALPSIFVECNGQVLSDAESLLNGQTIPNLNASGGGTKRFLRGSTSSGTTGGEDTHTLTEAEMPAHVHTMPNPTAGGAPYALGGTTSDGSAGTTNTGSTGSGNAHNTLPSYYEVVYVMRIK